MGALHFVGFRGNEYLSAVRIFGKPDFFHRLYDRRAKQEIVEGDVAVFANGEESKDRGIHSFNDSEHF